MTSTRGGEGEGTISDAVLCDAIREGEAWPLAVLWERHHAVALAWARGKDPDQAEDAVSEAFDAVYRALLSGGGPTEAFRAYLFRTVSRQLSRGWTESSRTLGVDDFDEVIDGALPAVGQLISEREEQEAAAAALEDLPLRWKRVILEVDVGGRSVQEVAAELELSPNSTSVLLKRAREGLKKSWLKRMHPTRDLSGECAACVAKFSEIRWGKRNGRSRGQAEKHLEGCQACRSRWKRFSEQAAVIGMVSAGVLATSPGWRRHATATTAVAAASIGLVAVTAGIAAPMLLAAPAHAPAPLPVPAEAAPADPHGSGAERGERPGASADEDGPALPGAPETGVIRPGGEGAESGSSTGTPRVTGLTPDGAEFANQAHVNVNDLDLDGDGTPGALTPEVWSRWGELLAVKVDAAAPETGLAGARFRLWVSELPSDCVDAPGLVEVTAPDGGPYEVESEPGGLVRVPGVWVGDDETGGGTMSNGLTQRCYVLEEIAAPEGYALPDPASARTEVIARSVPDPAAAAPVVVPNTKLAEGWLARTGGAWVVLAGGGLALAGVATGTVMLLRQRRRNRASESTHATEKEFFTNRVT